jgi:metal-sulfur cluster biosynthetic enzyme
MNQAPANRADRFVAPEEREVWRILADVPDPEIPVLSG